jgi:hypothetical protein
MRKSFWDWAAQSPLVVVPLACFGVALAFVPLERTYANFRVFLFPISAEEAATKLGMLAKFPIDLALYTSYAIGILADEYNARNPDAFRDNLPVAESDFRHWAQTCRKAKDLLKLTQAKISHEMQQRCDAGFPQPSDIAEVVARIQTLAADT